MLIFALLTLILGETNEAHDPEAVKGVLAKHCVVCHRENGAAPFSLQTWRHARPWSKSIDRAVTSDEMPPWDAVNGEIGHWRGDLRLDPGQKEILARWCRDGAPYFPGKIEYAAPEISTPDGALVVHFPEIELPGDGRDHYVYIASDYTTPAGGIKVGEVRWLMTNEAVSAVHHSVLTLGDINTPEIQDQNAVGEQTFAPLASSVYLPGRPTVGVPEGYGVAYRGGQRIVGLFHFGPSDSPRRCSMDAMLMVRENVSSTQAMGPSDEWNKRINLLPGKVRTLTATLTAPEDMLVFAYDVHMHLRGHSASIKLISGDVLLDVPRYDFHWQRLYEPLVMDLIPAGSEIAFEMTWDNSIRNPNNPDPTQKVTWGQRTKDEMAGLYIHWIPANPGATD